MQNTLSHPVLVAEQRLTETRRNMRLCQPNRIRILFAEDDIDEQYFFTVAVSKLMMLTDVKIVPDGVYLMEHLAQNLLSLPDIVFLDLLMPRKNGIECLIAMKQNDWLKKIPVVIYSSSVAGHYQTKCYENGASYFLQKGNYAELTDTIAKLLTNTAHATGPTPIDQFMLHSTPWSLQLQ